MSIITIMDNSEIVSNNSSSEDWMVSMENYKKSKESSTIEEMKTTNINLLYNNMAKTQAENYMGEEDTVKTRIQLVNDKYTNVYNELNMPYYHQLKQPDYYVRVYENALCDSFCNHTISLFEENPNYQELYPWTKQEMELVAKHNGNKEILKSISLPKLTTEFYFNHHKEEFEKEDEYIFQQLGKHLEKYYQDMDLPSPDYIRLFGSEDMGYQIQKYKKNEGRYIFHSDDEIRYDEENDRIGYRTVTFIFYLNDVEEGGETTFPEFQVKPKKGSLLLFPATWNYIHSANIPKSSDKYIITGWIYKHKTLKKK